MLEKLVDLWPMISGNIQIILTSVAVIAGAIYGIIKVIQQVKK